MEVKTGTREHGGITFRNAAIFINFAGESFIIMATKITGTVISGKRLGRKLGFPTANIALDSGTAITEGVYAARAVVDGQVYDGMANVGRKNTIPGAPVNPDTKPGGTVLEINIFGFDGDLYGKVIEVELLEYIRGERVFHSADELKTAVDRDRETIQEYFKTHK